MDLKDFVDRIELSHKIININIPDITYGRDKATKELTRIENDVNKESYIVDGCIQTTIEVATRNTMRCLEDDDIIRSFKTTTQNMKDILNRNLSDGLSYGDMVDICAYISSFKLFTNHDTITLFFKRDPIKNEVDNISEIMRMMFCSFAINVLSQLELTNLYENNTKASLFYMVVYRYMLDFLKEVPHISRTVMDKYELILLLVESQIVRTLNIYNMPFYTFMEGDIEDSKYTKIHSLMYKEVANPEY